MNDASPEEGPKKAARLARDAHCHLFSIDPDSLTVRYAAASSPCFSTADGRFVLLGSRWFSRAELALVFVARRPRPPGCCVGFWRVHTANVYHEPSGSSAI